MRKLTKSGNTFTSSTIATGFGTYYFLGLSVSSDGTLVYIADDPNCKIYEISYSGTSWTKSLIAGSPTTSCGNTDGA